MATEMDWTEKLIKHSFPEILMTYNRTTKEYKKDLSKVGKNWSSITETKINPNHKAIGALTGIKSGVIVLDFDDIGLYEEMTSDFPELKDAPRVATKKGFHLYFRWKDSYQEDLPAKVGKLDILKNNKFALFPGTTYKTETGQVIEYRWDNQGELGDLPESFIDSLKVEPDVVENVHVPVDDKPKYRFKCIYLNLILIIKLKYIDEYVSWFHLVCAMHNLGKTTGDLDTYKSEAIKMSKRSKKYSVKDFEKVWENCKMYNYTAGSIRYYARLSDKEKYNEICRTETGKDKEFYGYNETLLAKYVLQVAGDSIVLNKGKMYVYNEDRWQEETKEGNLTQALIETEVTYLYDKILLPNLYDRGKMAEDENLRDEVNEYIKVVYKTRKSLGYVRFSHIYKLIRNNLMAKDKKVEIFDIDPYVFAWKNTCYNLKTNVFFKPQKFDYILCTNDLDYHEPSNNEIETVKYIFESIFPDPEMRKAYISILKSGLSAYRVEKFIVCTGDGRNGKGVLNDFFQVLLGNYYGNLALTVLTKPIKEGPNTELRSIDKKRFLKATEPDSGSNEKLRMSNIKALTGENTMKARECYEGNYDITISATIILECNTKPYIITDGNEAEKQRLLIIPFGVCFTDNEEDIARDPEKYKPKNDIYKTTQFKEQHASALFDYIVNYISGTEICPCPLYIPDKCVQLAMQWIQDKDNICSWFFDTFEPEEGNLISVSEIFHMYKRSENYFNLSKADKNIKLKDFTETVSKKLRGIYIEPREYYTHSKGRVRTTAHSIKGYKIKTEDHGQISIVDDPE